MMKKSTHILLLFLILLSCTKDTVKLIDSLVVTIEMRDSSGNSNNKFTQGEELYFYYSEENKSSTEIKYYSLNCPLFNYRIYDANDNFIGTPSPENFGCTEELKLLSLSPGEVFKENSYWSINPSNSSLPVGNYKLKFYNRISIPEKDEEKIYDVSIHFQIE